MANSFVCTFHLKNYMNKYALLSLGAVALASPAFAAQTIPVPDVAPAAAGYQVVINIPQQRCFCLKTAA